MSVIGGNYTKQLRESALNTVVADLVRIRVVNVGRIPQNSLYNTIDGLSEIGVYINKDTLKKWVESKHNTIKKQPQPVQEATASLLLNASTILSCTVPSLSATSLSALSLRALSWSPPSLSSPSQSAPSWSKPSQSALSQSTPSQSPLS